MLLLYNADTMFSKKTKIIATIGPASSDEKVLLKMLKAGLNVARLNFSHGDFEEHAQKVTALREAAKNCNTCVAILQDLGGPKIRTGDLETEFVHLKKGAKVILTTKKVVGTAEKMSVNYKKLPSDVKKGHRILLNDGKQQLKVLSVKGNEVHCKVVYGGKIASRRGVNLPDTMLSISSFTAKDKRDLEFGIKHKVDFVALSFVQSARDVLALKRELKKRGSNAMVISKIETQAAINNLDEILEATDAIMVARGDLAVEVGVEKVPMLQKLIIKKANALQKPVIVATQMLETMTDNPVPTRAEVSDVANAILDGADAVMLSGETAMGEYPVEAVATMASVAKDTESNMSFEKRLLETHTVGVCPYTNETVAHHAAEIATNLCADAIVAFTETGATARMVAKFRIKQPVLVISPHEYVMRQMAVSFDCHPLKKLALKKGDDVTDLVRRQIIEKRLFKKGSRVVIVSGSIFGLPGETNTITVIEL